MTAPTGSKKPKEPGVGNEPSKDGLHPPPMGLVSADIGPTHGAADGSGFEPQAFIGYLVPSGFLSLPGSETAHLAASLEHPEQFLPLYFLKSELDKLEAAGTAPPSALTDEVEYITVSQAYGMPGAYIKEVLSCPFPSKGGDGVVFTPAFIEIPPKEPQQPAATPPAGVDGVYLGTTDPPQPPFLDVEVSEKTYPAPAKKTSILKAAHAKAKAKAKKEQP